MIKKAKKKVVKKKAAATSDHKLVLELVSGTRFFDELQAIKNATYSMGTVRDEMASACGKLDHAAAVFAVQKEQLAVAKIDAERWRELHYWREQAGQNPHDNEAWNNDLREKTAKKMEERDEQWGVTVPDFPATLIFPGKQSALLVRDELVRMIGCEPSSKGHLEQRIDDVFFAKWHRDGLLIRLIVSTHARCGVRVTLHGPAAPGPEEEVVDFLNHPKGRFSATRVVLFVQKYIAMYPIAPATVDVHEVVDIDGMIKLNGVSLKDIDAEAARVSEVSP